MKNEEIPIYDIAGFYGSMSYSEDKKYCAVSRNGYFKNDVWENGDMALLKEGRLLFKKRLQRPHDCHISDNGIVVCCDWLNSDELTGIFLVYNERGDELFRKENTANLGACSISNNGTIGLFETFNSDTSDSDKITIIDIPAGVIISRFKRPKSFIRAVINPETERIKLIDNKQFVFEIDFEGNQTNSQDYKNQVLTKGSIYDRLWLYTGEPDEIKLKDTEYLRLLYHALGDDDALYSFGKDRIYRMIGEYYEANGDIADAVDNWEMALAINPKAGIKRRLNALKKSKQATNNSKAIRSSSRRSLADD